MVISWTHVLFCFHFCSDAQRSSMQTLRIPNISSMWNSLPSLWWTWVTRWLQLTLRRAWELGEAAFIVCDSQKLLSILSKICWNIPAKFGVLSSSFRVDRNKYQIHIPLPPKIDPTVTMMQVYMWKTLNTYIFLNANFWKWKRSPEKVHFRQKYSLWCDSKDCVGYCRWRRSPMWLTVMWVDVKSRLRSWEKWLKLRCSM